MLDEVLKNTLQTEAQLPVIKVSDDTPTTDDALVELVLDGDGAAFGELFERYKRHVTRTVGRFFSERSEVEEHVQQAFVKAYTSIGRYRGGEDNAFAAWLTRITVNVCYDEFRRRQRRGQSLFTEMTTEEVDFVETVVDGRQPSEEQRLAANRMQELTREARRLEAARNDDRDLRHGRAACAPVFALQAAGALRTFTRRFHRHEQKRSHRQLQIGRAHV